MYPNNDRLRVLTIARKEVRTGTVGLQVGSTHEDTGTPERVRHDQLAKHPEYPLERLCIRVDEPFQLVFARQAQQLFEDRDDLGLVASHQGLTIRAETEDAIDAAVEVLSDFYGPQIRTGPPTIRYHDGVTLDQHWRSSRPVPLSL